MDLFVLKEGMDILSLLGAVLILGSTLISEVNFTKGMDELAKSD